MALTHQFGKEAEDRAARYLEERGYSILAKNYRAKGAELDIIALSGRILVFVEVRARCRNSLVLPEQTITRKKITNICKAARFFLCSTLYRVESYADQIRFDIITVNSSWNIKHMENAFTADWH